MSLRAIEWKEGRLYLLDQRVLPNTVRWVDCRSAEDAAEAIRDMTVRGAPAIGVTAAFGMALAARAGENLEAARQVLAASRPTAVNLFWALDRIMALDTKNADAIEAEALAIQHEDLAMNLAIGANGAELIPHGARILTICNTGSLATAGHGTALGMIRSAHQAGKEIFVWSCETRPRQQGLRLTAYELMHDAIPFRSLADSAASSLMARGDVNLVVAGADRIAANGDSANKVGTLTLAVLARHYGIPFYIAAPSSTIDPSLDSGEGIPIEERGAEELTQIEGVQVAPVGCPVWNPAFDVTPGDLISAIVTEEGVFRAPYRFDRILGRR